jgi:hypothetical protein
MKRSPSCSPAEHGLHRLRPRSAHGGHDLSSGSAVIRQLPADQAETLETIAGIDEVSVNEEIRQAIDAHIEARRADPEFRRRLQASIERNREILDRLAR